jgi:hypothetical protein
MVDGRADERTATRGRRIDNSACECSRRQPAEKAPRQPAAIVEDDPHAALLRDLVPV